MSEIKNKIISELVNLQRAIQSVQASQEECDKDGKFIFRLNNNLLDELESEIEKQIGEIVCNDINEKTHTTSYTFYDILKEKYD